MAVRNLTHEARNGLIEPVELSNQEKQFLSEMLSRLGELGVARISTDDCPGIDRLFAAFALTLALVDATSNSMRALLLAPEDLSQLTTFARAAEYLAGEHAIVVLNTEAVLATLPESKSALADFALAVAPLFAEKPVWIILLAQRKIHERLDSECIFLYRVREDANEGRITFALRVREPSRPERTLFFKLTLDEANEVMRIRETQASEKLTGFLEGCLHHLVQAARNGDFENQDNHTMLATCAFLVFDAALPLRAGYENVLVVDVIGNRYRLTRNYAVRR